MMASLIISCMIVTKYVSSFFLFFLICRIRDRDYEQITEKPEHTIANLARIEEEKMRKDKKIKDRQYTSGNTITGNARFIRRPAMSAEYLAGGYDDDEGEAEEADERFERPKPRAVVPAAAKPSKDQVKAKPKAAPKKKGPVSSDYLEYDEEDGSDMEDDDEGDDNEEMEDDDDDEEVRGLSLFFEACLFVCLFPFRKGALVCFIGVCFNSDHHISFSWIAPLHYRARMMMTTRKRRKKKKKRATRTTTMPATTVGLAAAVTAVATPLPRRRKPRPRVRLAPSGTRRRAKRLAGPARPRKRPPAAPRRRSAGTSATKTRKSVAAVKAEAARTRTVGDPRCRKRDPLPLPQRRGPRPVLLLLPLRATTLWTAMATRRWRCSSVSASSGLFSIVMTTNRLVWMVAGL